MTSMSKDAPRYLVIAGPTGSGKSALALELAERLAGEIVGCDSVQIYRGFDIGSAKPTAFEQERVRHHMINVADWHDAYDAERFAREAHACLEAIIARGKLPIVVGGSGLYLRALRGDQWHADLPSDEALRLSFQERSTRDLHDELKRLDPERAAALHANDRVRIVRALELVTLLGHPVGTLAPVANGRFPGACVVLLDPPRQVLHGALALRTRQMLASGLIAEVAGLLASGCPIDAKPMQSIGYKQTAAYLTGRLAREHLENSVLFATRQYAKRQITWFKKVAADLRLEDASDVNKVAGDLGHAMRRLL